GRARAIVEQAKPGDVEWLPVRIADPKGDVFATDYFVLNPLAIRDCIDQKKSKAKLNSIDPESLYSCESLVLDEAKLSGVILARPRFWLEVVLVRRELAEKLAGAGVTGLNFIEPVKYTGLF